MSEANTNTPSAEGNTTSTNDTGSTNIIDTSRNSDNKKSKKSGHKSKSYYSALFVFCC
jgi:hypothetical protein